MASFEKHLRLWRGLVREHELLTYAGAIAFQALVALVAVALLTVAVLGEIGRTDVWTKEIGPRVQSKVLPDVYAGANAVVTKIFTTSSLGLIVLASVIAIVQIAGVVRTCRAALLRIYGQNEDRPWSTRFPLSIGIAVVLTAALLGAILLGTAASTAVHGAWGLPFSIFRWLLAALLIAVAFALLVRFAPPRPRPKRWVSAGAGLVVLGWIAQTLIFDGYLSVVSYRGAASSLFGVYFLTTYLFVGAIVLLVGIELDELLRKGAVS